MNNKIEQIKEENTLWKEFFGLGMGAASTIPHELEHARDGLGHESSVHGERELVIDGVKKMRIFDTTVKECLALFIGAGLYERVFKRLKTMKTYWIVTLKQLTTKMRDGYYTL